jgi:hypothetical protein
MSETYSFQDFNVNFSGPPAYSFELGYGAQVADEGITIERTGDKNTQTAGADGEVMNSLHAANMGICHVRLLKTSSTNALLQGAYNAQKLQANLWGQNVIRLSNTRTGEVQTMTGVAFAKEPTTNYRTVGDILEWTFHCADVDTVLGTYD